MADRIRSEDLSLQNGHNGQANGRPKQLLVLGEVLWDVFEKSTRLGGAPLNFAVHANRLGFNPRLISAVGRDELGDRAAETIATLGLHTGFLQRIDHFKTGTAQVELGPGDRTRFLISRPAAYDTLCISDEILTLLQTWGPAWFYYGTLFSHLPQGKAVLHRLLEALPGCSRFYDLNLRPEFDSPALVRELLLLADVVKLNQEEMAAVHETIGLPGDKESFCREGAKRFGWSAVCITLGSRGCAMLCGEEYIEAEGQAVEVADPVGAGDAFAAAFLHGLVSRWPARQIADFSNRVGALVASRHGAIPDWNVQEAVEL